MTPVVPGFNSRVGASFSLGANSVGDGAVAKDPAMAALSQRFGVSPLQVSSLPTPNTAVSKILSNIANCD